MMKGIPVFAAACALAGSVAFGTTIDFTQTAGVVKPVNGIGQPPMVGMPMNAPMFHYLKEAGIPHSRLHDVGGFQGQNRYVDIPNVFRNFDADENDPKNYDFGATDILVKRLGEQGVAMTYQLGATIENTWEWGLKIGSNERIVPPKDFAKWARIVEHIIRHYTEGWANGMKANIPYWEIWNEPDNREDPSISPLWQAPFEEYIRFYGVVAPYLKAKFPHLKIGGYGMCGFYDAVGASAVGAAHSSPRTQHFMECVHKFLKAARDNNWPLDFFSYHSYSDAPDALKQVHYADKILNDYGFTRDKTERVFNEWLPVVAHENLGTSKQAAQIAAELIGLQNGPCDMACIYDGRCGVGNYSPLFNPMTYEPHKAYYVFKMFNELRKLGKSVKTPAMPTGIYITAATDGGTNAAVMVANISGKPWKPAFDFGPNRTASALVIDENRTYVGAEMPETVGPDSVWLIRVSPASSGWRAYEGNPVLGNAKLGTCFDVNVVTDGPAPYTMYFSWRPKAAIALVRSTDGFHWTQEPEICLEPDKTSGWENMLNRSCTVKKDGVWHMWYTGQVFENGNWRRGWSRIGYATSTDGVHFKRVRKEPVLVPELAFEKTSVMNPYVRWDAARGVWRMWYAAGEIYEPNVLCYAESKDGLSWQKRPELFFGHGEALSWDRDRVGACEVHPLPDGRWAMFYIGYSDVDTARIGCAISPDGVTNWRRFAQNPIVAPDLNTWNGSACYKPSVVRDEKNNRWLLYYNGRNGQPEYVGMAVHDGLDLEAPSVAPADTKAMLSAYVRRFNEKDDEIYTNAIPNAAAEKFMLENCPRFACPDKDIERTYYFRWWTFRKHLKKDDKAEELNGGKAGGWRITEFLPKVSWSGKDNTIVCPAGHHLREGRWLRDPQYIEDDARFWLADPEAAHRWLYSSWLFTGARLVADVTGQDKLPDELLDDAVGYFERWEKGFKYDGGLPMGGDGKGGFVSIDNHEGTEISLGGSGYKPLFASAMWSEAKAISDVARKAGRAELAAKFAAKAEVVRQSLFDRCWNPGIGFFTTSPTNGPTGAVRELHGYAPWYFNMPTDGRMPDWAQLGDAQGFAAPYGLTFPERRAKGFVIDYSGHECKWNGPSWPFATSIALTAFANDLHSRQTATGHRQLFARLLWQYAAQQKRQRDPKTEGDYAVVPWIDENLHPDDGLWLARKIILETPAMRKSFPRERGKDYNHSTFCDLVISGLVGFAPGGDGRFAVDPLFPAEWDYLTLEDVRYRGHDVTIRWQRGQGLSVEVDGKTVARRDTLGRIDVRY